MHSAYAGIVYHQNTNARSKYSTASLRHSEARQTSQSHRIVLNQNILKLFGVILILVFKTEFHKRDEEQC